jgi:hypothetical protein
VVLASWLELFLGEELVKLHETDQSPLLSKALFEAIDEHTLREQYETLLSISWSPPDVRCLRLQTLD